jgi:hypothetical protein
MSHKESYPPISSHKNADVIYKSLGLSKEDDKYIRILDVEKELVLVSFINEPPLDKHRHLRGTIVDSVTGIIKARSPNLPVELTEIPEKTTGVCRLVTEGTMLRAFYHNKKWYCSSHSNITGDGHWGKSAFNYLRRKTTKSLRGGHYDDDLLMLNECFCYILLLSVSGTRRIIKNPSWSVVFCVAIYHDGVFTVPTERVGRFELLPVVENIEETMKTLPPNFIGVSILDSQGNDIRIMDPTFIEKRILLGPEPNPLVSFVHHLREKKELERFKQLFPCEGFYRDVEQRYHSLGVALLKLKNRESRPIRFFFSMIDEEQSEENLLSDIEEKLQMLTDFEMYTLIKATLHHGT